jgi:hypothetical protein
MPRIRNTLSAPGKLTVESAMDPPTDTRPSRTPTRGGIAPRFHLITFQPEDDEITLVVTASLLIGSTWVEGPHNADVPTGTAIRRFWSETPGDGTPPQITGVGGYMSIANVALKRWHAGVWRLSTRYRATGIVGGLEVVPFVVKVL